MTFDRPSAEEEAVAAMFRESDALGPILEEWALLDEMGLANDPKFLAELRKVRRRISAYIADIKYEEEGLQ